MKVDEAEVRRIAKLARLSLDEHEIGTLATELSQILDHIDQIEDAPIPSSGVEVASLTLRHDIVTPSLRVDEVESRAPHFRRGHFVVPKVLADE